MSICRTTLKSFELKKLISKKEFLSSSPEEVERFDFTSKDEDGRIQNHSVFFKLNSPIARKLNRVPLIYDDEKMEIERYSSMYLLSESKDKVRNGKESTIQKHSESIEEFFKFCSQKKIDWKVIPRNKRNKPGFLYSKHLKILVENGQLAPSTAKRKMSAVIQFHRYCEEEYGTDFFVNPPYTNKLAIFTDQKGIKRLALTQDEQIRYAKENSIEDELYIEDGGRLKPLTADEQYVLHEVLNSEKLKSNIEMRYIFMTALLSGARLQSVLTMSVKDINMHIDLPEGVSDVNHIVKAGRGKDRITDSKNDKPINIYIAYSWIEKLKLYVESKRYAIRRERYFKNVGIENPTVIQMEEAYLFLTNRGTPYYDRKSDLKKFNPNNTRTKPREGGGVHDFLSKYILPMMLEKLGADYRFHFHDLRATFGVNLRDALREEYGEAMSDHEIEKQIQSRLSHNDITTTRKYVKYSPKRTKVLSLERIYREKIGMSKLTDQQVKDSLKSLGQSN